jgi:hypothetical protein
MFRSRSSWIDDAYARDRRHVARRDRTRAIALDVEDGVFDVVNQRQRQRLEVADDLVHIFDDTRDGLMLVHDTINAHTPDSRAAQGRQQHATHRVAERVPEAALERLQAEFGDIGIVLALG